MFRLNNKHCKYLCIIIFIFFIIYCLSKYTEGFQLKNLRPNNSTSGTCSSRSACTECLNGSKDSTGSVCYWCKNKGCVNPDNYYDPNTCSSDKQKC
jgi:hypothetical protein